MEPAAPTFVVALPVHNGSGTIEAAIRSVTNQIDVDVRCIISENWSTDATASIINNLNDSSGRLRIIQPDRLCPAPDNFRFAFEQSVTLGAQYFTWLAADDEMFDGYLAGAARQLELCPDAEFTVADAEFVLAGSTTRLSMYSPARGLTSSRPFARLLSYACQPRWNEIYSVYRPSTFDVLGLITDRFGFDVVLTWRLLLRGPASRIDMIGNRYSVRGDSPPEDWARLKHKLQRARAGDIPRWSQLWCDLYRAADEAPTNRVRRQARLALLVAAFHPRWLRKFAQEALRSIVEDTSADHSARAEKPD